MDTPRRRSRTNPNHSADAAAVVRVEGLLLRNPAAAVATAFDTACARALHQLAASPEGCRRRALMRSLNQGMELLQLIREVLAP
jgi:hypothetical protein